MNKFLALFVLSAMLVATLNPVSAGSKGGDIIVLGGGGGGGMPAIISSGNKKKGSMIFFGRRRRSIEAVQAEEPQYTVYRLAPEAQQQ